MSGVGELSDGVVVAIGLFAFILVAAVVLTIVHALQGPHVVPDVRNQTLSAAKSQLKSAGLSYTYDKNQGVFGILDESNWYVCGETPTPGTRTKHSVLLVVRHWNC
jgi:beta-lactam-binding protein with PASTA domain